MAEERLIKILSAIVSIVIVGIGATLVLLNDSPSKSERVIVPMQHAVAVQAQTAPAATTQKVVPVADRKLARLGDWTPQIGVRIAKRGLSWVGWPYSFAGGGSDGPSYGVAVDKDSANDASVRGFDCSGLAMYALAPWRDLTHFAATQYGEVGGYHPPLDQLQPGDLIFWSPDPSVEHIGHVAIYVGNGQVVQAPRSGALIQVTPLYAVERGYIGATRPLT